MAPLLSAVCGSPSSQPPPGSGAAKSNKNYRNVRPGGKLLAASVGNYIPQFSPPGGHSASRLIQKQSYPLHHLQHISFHIISFHFIRSHASLDSEPRRPRVRLRGACAWRRECARVQRALGACAVAPVVLVVTHSFSARGDDAHPSHSAERGDGHTPTLRVDTHPPQEGPTYTHTPHSLSCPSSTNFSGGRLTKDPGVPLLSAACGSPITLATSWIWSCEEQKNSEATADLSSRRAPRSHQ